VDGLHAHRMVKFPVFETLENRNPSIGTVNPLTTEAISMVVQLLSLDPGHCSKPPPNNNLEMQQR
jgi:hypothetical protein